MARILVVEDALSLRRDIAEMLQYEGYDVQSAENGAVGLEMARNQIPDLVICDIMMPVMDGFQMLRALRADSLTAGVPLIFLTARTDRMDQRQGMELGADDFITKPFHTDELLATVRAQIKKHTMRAQAAERRLNDLRNNIILALPHELRTPLNSVLGFSELLMSDAMALPPDRVRAMAEHIHSAGGRLYALVENYLLYANVELLLADPVRLAATREDTAMFPHLTIRACAEATAHAHQRANQLAVSLAHVDRVAINEISLKKLFDELIDNAFKFSGPHTTVRISGELIDTSYRVIITDDGIGMTAQQIAEIGAYMQFSRRIQEQQGTGLGLVIVRRLADVFQIGFHINSAPAQGTSITLDLRLASAHQS